MENYIKIFRKFERGEASVAEIHQLLMWLKDETNVDSWILHEWEKSPEFIDPAVRNTLYTQINKAISPKKRRSSLQLWKYRGIQIAAAVILLFVGLFFIDRDVHEKIELVAENSIKECILPDSSKVYLTPNSKLRYYTDFGTKNRNVELSGEAFFKVHRDTTCPFHVIAERFSVRVLGTSFNVLTHSDSGIDEVVLASGCIDIVSHNSNANTIRLNPGQMYSLSKEGVSRVQEVDVVQYTNWTSGFFEYNNMTIKDLIDWVCRYYKVHIYYPESIANYHSSGQIDLNQNVPILLNDIQCSLPIVWYREQDIYYLQPTPSK